MLTRTPIAAALAAISLAYAGIAVAQTDVLVVPGTSVGILPDAPTARGPAGDLSASRKDEQKYMELKLKEVLISGVIQNGDPVQSPGAHRNEIHLESYSWGMNSTANTGPELMLRSATGHHLSRGTATDGARLVSPLPASPVPGGVRAAGGPSMQVQSLSHHAPAFAAPAGRR
jgi:hypothetical protein